MPDDWTPPAEPAEITPAEIQAPAEDSATDPPADPAAAPQVAELAEGEQQEVAAEDAGGAEEPPAEDPNARLQADLLQRDRELVAEKAAVRAQKAMLDEYQHVRQLGQSDPVAAARAIGIDPMDLAQRLLGGGEEEAAKPDPHLSSLKEQIEQQNKVLQDMQQQTERSQVHAALRGMIGAGDGYQVLGRLSKDGDAVLEKAHGIAMQYQQAGQPVDMPKILASLEAEATQNIFASLDALDGVESFEKWLRAKAAKLAPGQAAAAAPSSTSPAAPTKAITQDLAGEAGTELRQETEEEADAALREAVAGFFKTQGE